MNVKHRSYVGKVLYLRPKQLKGLQKLKNVINVAEQLRKSVDRLLVKHGHSKFARGGNASRRQ